MSDDTCRRSGWTEEGLRQDVWLPDERLRQRAMVEALAPSGYHRDRRYRGRRSGRPQHLPHPRKGRREGLFRPRPRARREGRAAGAGQVDACRGGRLRGAGRGPEISAGRRWSISSIGPQSYHRLPELLGEMRAGRRIVETEFPEDDKFAALPQRTGPAPDGGLPHRAGRLRQVLHLLRRALYARHGVLAAGRRYRARGRGRWSSAACAS